MQLASAPWARVAVYQAILNGGLGLAPSSGMLAEIAGLPRTLLAAGLGGIGMALVARTCTLTDEVIDLSLPPAVPPPKVVAHDMMSPILRSLRRPVVVTIAYSIEYDDVEPVPYRNGESGSGPPPEWCY